MHGVDSRSLPGRAPRSPCSGTSSQTNCPFAADGGTCQCSPRGPAFKPASMTPSYFRGRSYGACWSHELLGGTLITSLRWVNGQHKPQFGLGRMGAGKGKDPADHGERALGGRECEVSPRLACFAAVTVQRKRRQTVTMVPRARPPTPRSPPGAVARCSLGMVTEHYYQGGTGQMPAHPRNRNTWPVFSGFNT